MRLALILSVASLALIGCSSSPGDDSSVAPGSGVVQNPGGKPKTEQEAQIAVAQQKQGELINQQREKDAAAMAAAKARSGGQ